MKNITTSGRLIRGALTAIITPFDKHGEVDTKALARLALWQVEQGIHGLVPCGTTGEGATLTPDEQTVVVTTVARAVDGRIPVVAGCGTNDTLKTVAAARRVAAAGADALLVVSPYYNKPNRSGMIAHYEEVAAATPLPLIVYNVPGRTGQNLGSELILRLAQIAGVVAVKEAAADLDQLGELIEGRPEGFAVLSGDDSLALPAMALGADGVISVVANEAPHLVSEMISAAESGNFKAARHIHYRLLPLMRANFVETNPVPVKTAMALMGRCGPALRPPLGPLAEDSLQLIKSALDGCDLERSII